MIKRALAAALCLMLVFALLPKTARAITPDYTLYYNTEDSSLHKGGINGDIFTENSNWSGDGNNLTLSNFQFTTSARIALEMPSGAWILINGGNSMLKSTFGSGDNFGIYSRGDLRIATVSGYGALTATCGPTIGDSYGVYVSAVGVVINDSTDLKATGGAAGGSSYGVYAVDSLQVGNFGSLTATGGTATNGVSAGVLVTAGGISVSNGRLTATGGAADDNSYGVFATGDITTIADDASIMGTGSQATTLSSYGVYSENGDITACGGSITGTAGPAAKESYGVYAGSGIAASGGSITGTGSTAGNNSFGVYAFTGAAASGGNITGTGGQATSLSSYGVFAQSGAITAKAGSITGTGGVSVNNTSFGMFSGAGSVALDGGSITGIGVQGGPDSNKSFGIYTPELAVKSGRLVGESAAGGKALVRFGFSNPNQVTYYWRKSKAGPYTASASSPLPTILSGETYVEIRTGLITFLTQPAVSTTVTQGSIAGSLSASAVSPANVPDPTLAWFCCDKNGVISGSSLGTGGTLDIPTGLAAGTYYYICQATLLGVTVKSNVAAVKVTATPIVAPTISVSPVKVFLQGTAPETTVTVGAGITGFGLANLGSVQMGPKDGPLTLLAEGTEYDAAEGSIIITLHKSYLNALMPGAYTLRIYLTGAGYPSYVQTTIIVNAADATVPKTGDAATPMLWLGLMLLTGAGLAGSVVVRRKRQNG